jgi:hypothetical protein
MTEKSVRGLLNNNPLNIRISKTKPWKGEVRPSRDASFAEFRSMEWGYRAAFKLLDNYQRLHSCRTLSDFISRWAPPSENDSQAYVRTVCSISHLASNEVLPQPSKACLTGGVDKLILLLMAMTCVECGIRMKEINQEEIRDGYEEWTHPLPSL